MKEKIQIRLSEVLYYSFLVIMCGAKGFGLYDGQLIYKGLFILAMACIAGKLMLQKYTVGEFLTTGILGVLALFATLHSGEKGILLCYGIVVGMKEISLDKSIKTCAWTYGLSFLLMSTCYGIFLEQSPFFTGEKMGVTGVARWTLGYPHPNTLHVTYLALCGFIIYALKERYSRKEAFLLSLGNLYIFLYSISYTGVLCTFLLIWGALYVNKRRELSKGEYLVLGAVYPASLFYAFLAPYLLPKSVLLFLRENFYTVYHRLELSKRHVTISNLSLFGTKLSEVTTEEFSLDNSFLYCLVSNGGIFCVIILICYGIMMFNFITKKKKMEILITAVFLIQAVMEPFLFNTSFKNITIFFLGALLWEKTKKRERIKLLRDPSLSVPRKLNIQRIKGAKVEEKERKIMKTAIVFFLLLTVLLYLFTQSIPKRELFSLWEYLRGVMAWLWAVLFMGAVISRMIVIIKSTVRED